MKHHYLQLGLFGLYIILATLLMISYGVGITPDRYIVVLFVGALLIRHTKHFIHDFAPFLFILVGYDFLRGFADKINHHIHYFEPIKITQFIFHGHIPTVDLQRIFYTSGHLHWYDYGAAYLYMVHFAIPLIFAFMLWFHSRKNFREFMLALSMLSYAAFLSFLAFPVAPPWLASQMGLIPPLTKILDVVLSGLPQVVNSSIPTFYGLINSNLVAAVPSMHAAYAFLVFLFARKFYPSVGWLMIAYPVVMWLTIIYLGEHYLIDILVGVLFAYIFYIIAHITVKKFGKELDFL